MNVIDPDGKETTPPGDYYNQKGDKMGTDGINDGKLYIVKNGRRNEHNIKRALENEDYMQAQSLSVLVPNSTSREAMGKAADDTGENQEQGGVGLLLKDGTYTDARTLPGKVAKEGDAYATVDVNPNVENVPKIKELAQANLLAPLIATDVDYKTVYDYHTHPTGKWVQTPSDVDISLAKTKGDLPLNRYVISPKTNTVHIYNGDGVITKFPLDKFRTIKPN